MRQSRRILRTALAAAGLVAGWGGAPLAVGEARAGSYHFGRYDGPSSYAGYAPVVIRQTVVVNPAPAPVLGGVVSATGIRQAPLGAPALYVIEPSSPARRPARRGQGPRFGESGPPPASVTNGATETAPDIRTIRPPRG